MKTDSDFIEEETNVRASILLQFNMKDDYIQKRWRDVTWRDVDLLIVQSRIILASFSLEMTKSLIKRESSSSAWIGRDFFIAR